MTEPTEYGLFAVDAEARTVKGLLLPWGETSRPSNVAPVYFERGKVTVPADPSVVTLNRHHSQFDPIGRATVLEDREAGVYAEFSIARTPEGDAFLDDYTGGRLNRLSAELRGIVRDVSDKAKGLAAALTGAAVVTEGAFASAGLFELREAEAVATYDTETAEVTVSISIPSDAPAEESTEPETAPTEEASMAQATAPASLANQAPEEVGATGVFEAITAVRTTGSSDAENMLAALADIKISGTGALPAAGVLQPAWLGEVWAGKAYERRYMNLIRNGSITAIDEKGFTLSTGAELVQSWAGNKTELPTGTATTAVLTSTFAKWGFAADIAREFYDIPSGRPVIEAFIRQIADSYARVTDKWTLQQMVAAAGTPINADTYPAGYSTAIGKIIQAIDLVDDTDVDASFVIVAPDVFKALRYTPFEQIPQFLNFGANSAGGSVDGITVVRDKTGTLAAGQVLAGGREAAHVNELPGASPLNLDALDIARGGVDRAAVGYSQFLADYAPGLVIVRTAP